MDDGHWNKHKKNKSFVTYLSFSIFVTFLLWFVNNVLKDFEMDGPTNQLLYTIILLSKRVFSCLVLIRILVILWSFGDKHHMVKTTITDWLRHWPMIHNNCKDCNPYHTTKPPIKKVKWTPYIEDFSIYPRSNTMVSIT